MKRKIITKKRVLILLSALVLIAISLVAFLHTKFIRSNIKNQLTDYLKNNQGILLEIESLDFNLLKPEFTLENISVKKYPGNSPPILKAKSISLKIPYSIIWGKTPEIKLLEIRDPVINVFTDKNGLSNIPSPPSPTPPPLNPVNESTKIPPFICHLFEISNCKISFTDLQKDYNLDIPSLSLLLKHINNGKHSLSVDTANTGSFTYQNTRFPIDTFSIKSLLDNENIAIDTCKIKSGENLLNFGGSLHDVFEKRLLEDIHLDTTVDLYSLRNFTGHYFNGKIHLSSRLNGPLDNPGAEIKLNSKNLADKNKNPLSIDGNISWKEKKLLIPALNVSWKNNGELLCSGQLHPLQEKKDKSEGNRLNVKLKSVNLELLQPFIDTHIISTASGSIDLAWKELSKKSLNGKAVLNIQPSPSPQTGIIKSFAELLPNTGDATDNAPQDKNKIPLEVELTATAKSGRFNLDLKRLALPGIRGEVNIETGTTPGFSPGFSPGLTGTTPGLTGGDELSPLSGSFYLKIDSMQ
ncbi:MAG: hypothetical protein GY757_34275, partial [bacterium]|nr:hypothetical protein [bacterium]